jgi:hypothetical protein
MPQRATRELPMPRFSKLSDADQLEVQRISNKAMLVWNRPELTTEGKLLLLDDVAVLFSEFGMATLDASVDWYRQHHTRSTRPTIPEIRTRCAEIKGSQRNPLSQDMRQYFDELKQHPERFVPVQMILRDASNLDSLKRAREKAGRPMSRDEIRDWMRTRNAATHTEWAGMVKAGKHLAPVDERARASGEREMQPLI